MTYSGECVRYGRVGFKFDEKIDNIRITAPSGSVETVFSFDYQPIVKPADIVLRRFVTARSLRACALTFARAKAMDT